MINKAFFQISFFLSVFIVSILISGFLFTSCSPNLDDVQASQTSNNSSDSEEEEDEGDICYETGACQDACNDIYLGYLYQKKCMDRGDITVGKMETIYRLITPKDKTDLEYDLKSIIEGEHDIDTGDFKNYLEISGRKWIEDIQDSSNYSSSVSPSLIILEWLAENKEVAEILKDTDDGLNILEALLVKEGGAIDTCNTSSGDTTISKPVDGSILLGIENGKLKARNGSTQREISTNNMENCNLYKYISGSYLGNEKHNVFTYSTESANGIRDNTALFSMAFDLLEHACEMDKDKEAIFCKKYFVCWSGWLETDRTNYDDSRVEDTKVITLFENHKSELEIDDVEYDECGANDLIQILD